MVCEHAQKWNIFGTPKMQRIFKGSEWTFEGARKSEIFGTPKQSFDGNGVN